LVWCSFCRRIWGRMMSSQKITPIATSGRNWSQAGGDWVVAAEAAADKAIIGEELDIAAR